MMHPRFVFVSGGVISGLGKGITTASIALLLKSAGLSVAPVKADMYLNIDAGTMNPLEHGEIFVTDDGTETDQDLGHYERFLGQDLGRENYITAGQIYKTVLDKERSLGFGGRSVEAYYDVPQEITRRFENLGKKADVVLVEFGGTVGEYQNILFFEAARRLKIKYRENVVFIHVGYLPIPDSLGEMKTKPIQQSIHELNSLGISPDFVICRSEEPVDQKRKEKIALSAAIEKEDIFANPDVETIYEVPILLDEQGLTGRLLERLAFKRKRSDLTNWRKMVKKAKGAKQDVKIAMVGKYYTSGGFALEDSYVSVVESIKHAAWANGLRPSIFWFDSEKLETLSTQKLTETLKNMDGIIVPQGWGSRGVEGKIKAVQYARENGVPYLGLCFGLQMAVIEFARHVCKLPQASSTEVNPKTSHPVVHIMPDQAKYLASHQYGGTIRLGAWPCRLARGTHVFECYTSPLIYERHRHRYEVNNKYLSKLTKKGMVVAGTTDDGKLVEAIELDRGLHPFFVGTQFHPEYKSRFLSPHPLFLEFIRASAKL